MVSADLPGTLESIAFESGRRVQEGDVLAELDTRQERAQLAAAEAKLALERANLERARGLIAEKIMSPSDYDQADAAEKQAQAAVGEIHATIARKTIRAPFSGVLGIRQANLGQYLVAGAPIVSLQAMDPVFVNFSVPQEHVGHLKAGTEVRVAAEDSPAMLRGRLTAIDSVVDEATRNVQAQATFANPAGTLHPGMFVQANVAVGVSQTVIALPASSVNYAPYGDSVFVVSQLKGAKGTTYQGVEQRFVKLGVGRGDQVAVLSGVNAGDQVVTSGVFKLRSGAAVLINNRVQPSNMPAPRPEDR
jgi:membrane fusion protein (multidrug efflux system)